MKQRTMDLSLATQREHNTQSGQGNCDMLVVTWGNSRNIDGALVRWQ